MSNLLSTTAKITIGMGGITLILESVNDDLAKMLESASTFSVQAPTRHTLGTSDVKLVSAIGLGFIERPTVEDPNTGVIEDNNCCGCPTDAPLQPIEVLDSTFSVAQASDEMYATLLPDIDRALLGNVNIVIEEMPPTVEGGKVSYKTSMEGEVFHINNDKYNGALALLEFGVSDYIKSILGVYATENPDAPIFTLENYGVVLNFTAKSLYTAMTPEGKFYAVAMLGVFGVTAPDIIVKTNWGINNPKFRYTKTVINTEKLIISKAVDDGDTPLVPKP